MHDLEKALRDLRTRHIGHPEAALQIEVAIITCGGTATLRQAFVTIRDFEPPALQAEGTRAIGQAVNMALDEIKTLKRLYRDTSIDYDPPMVWLMAAGVPEDAGWQEAAKRANAADALEEITVYPLAIGDDKLLSALGEFSSRISLLMMEPDTFVRMFEWQSSPAPTAPTHVPPTPSLPDGPPSHDGGITLNPTDWGGMDEDRVPFSIFLCYRKEDSEPVAHWMYDCLIEHFGEDNVFLDSKIAPGANWKRVLEESVRKCGVLLVIVGPNWLGETSAGKLRLHEKDDYVRMEIEIALDRQVPIIPVFLNDTTPPIAPDLPETISAFANLQGVKLEQGKYFKMYIGNLIEVLRQIERSDC